MPLLDRDLIGDFLKTYFTLLVLMSILFFVNVVLGMYSSIFGGEHNKLGWAFIHFLYRLPQFYVETGVVVVATSILWVIMRKARANEILAWVAGGISLRRLSMPLILAAGVISTATLSVALLVAGESSRKAEWVEKVRIQEKPESTLTLRKDIFQRGVGDRFYLMQRFDSASQTMTQPTIIDLDPLTKKPRMVLHASLAYRETDVTEEKWVIVGATVRRLDSNGKLFSMERIPSMYDSDLDKPFEPRLGDFFRQLDDPAKMTFAELDEFIKVLDAQGKETTQLKMGLHTKVALPLAVVVIAILICTQAMKPKAEGVFKAFGGGLGWIAAYYVAFLLCQKVAEAQLGVSPVLTAWLPNAGFGLYGLGSLLRGGSLIHGSR